MMCVREFTYPFNISLMIVSMFSKYCKPSRFKAAAPKDGTVEWIL